MEQVEGDSVADAVVVVGEVEDERDERLAHFLEAGRGEIAERLRLSVLSMREPSVEQLLVAFGSEAGR